MTSLHVVNISDILEQHREELAKADASEMVEDVESLFGDDEEDDKDDGIALSTPVKTFALIKTAAEDVTSAIRYACGPYNFLC